MKNNILTDLKTLALLFLDMRKARKCGTEIKLLKLPTSKMGFAH